MMQLTLYKLTLIFSSIFSQMNHPVSVGLMLLNQTITMCSLTALMTKSFDFLMFYI